ncbi:hypothetical protein niasHT_023188 [Heterodera trifolii]|uniref:Uncharacterized protein n=1 Tax=Heterodera trifolii TaxID=157864 RepID=A0ABD2JDC2_9BILA
MVQANSTALDIKAEDSTSESSTSTADRFSFSAIAPSVASVPPRLANSSSWTFISAATGDNFHHFPSQPNFGWVRQLFQRPISVRINSFLRSEPLPDTEFFDWLSSMTIGHQQPRGERFPVDIHFVLETVRMDDLSARNVRVLSSELVQLNLPSGGCPAIAPRANSVSLSHPSFSAADGTASPPPPSASPPLSSPHFSSSTASLCFDLLPFPICRMASVFKFPRHLFFIYPQNANFTARTGQNARNISVKAELFGGKSENRIEKAFIVDGKLVGEVFSTVQYHSRNAQFGGTEWKLIMPRGGRDGLYLRFTFMHVSCKPRGDDAKTMCTTPIGFSWLPFQSADGFSSCLTAAFPSGDHRLPISLDPPPPALCFLSPHVNVPNVRWLDSHRPLFHLRVLCVSSIQPQDPHLNAFLISSRAFLRSFSAISADLFATSIRNVLKCSPEQMLSFLHIILHRILEIISFTSLVQSPSALIANGAFETLCQLALISSMLLDGRVDARNRSQLLLDFVRLERLPKQKKDNETREEAEEVWTKREQKQNEEQRNNRNGSERKEKLKEKPTERKSPGANANGQLGKEMPTEEQRKSPGTSADFALLHVQLVRLFIASSGHARDSACSSAWFLLSLIHRSLVEHIEQTQGHLLPRKLRFGGFEFLKQLAQLGELLIGEVLERAAKNAAQTDAINSAWAQFLRESVALLSRGWIIEQMKHYCNTMDARIDALSICVPNSPLCAQLLSLKLSFFRLLLSHHHFLFLCLPFPFDFSLPSAEDENKKTKHFQNLFCAAPFSTGAFGTLRKSTTNLANSRKRNSPKGKTNGGGSKRENAGGGGNSMTKSAVSLSSVPSLSSATSSFVSASHPPFSLKLFSDLSVDHHFRHLPLFLFLSQLHVLLRVRSSLCASYVSLLHSLIASHENDWRLNGENSELGQRVAAMYSPLLAMAMELGQDKLEMDLPESDERGELERKRDKENDKDKDSGLASEEEERNSGRAMAMAPTADGTAGKSQETTRKKLLLCVCWLLRSLPMPSLLAHFRQFSPDQFHRFVRLLRSLLFTFSQFAPPAFPHRHSVDSFVHLIGGIHFCHGTDECDFPQHFLAEKRRQSMETMSISTLGDNGNNGNGTMPKGDELTEENGNGKATNSSSTAATDGIRWRMRRRNNSAAGHLEKALLSRQLSAEVLLLVLDLVELLFQLAPFSPHLLPDLLRLLLFPFSCLHSLSSLFHLFRSLRAFVRKFPDFLLVESDQQLLTALCQQLLRQMAAENAEVRQQAATSALAQLKIAFRHSKGGFVRLNRCLTSALCSLVSTSVASGKALDENALRASLNSLMPEAKKSEKAEFMSQLEQLVVNLNAILSDTFKLSAHIDDFEMSVDLMHRIAHGYRNNFKLRIAWLLGIAGKHLEERKTYAEAAQCFLHCCAIVATTLLNAGTADDELLPRSVFEAFEALSENISEEWEDKRGKERLTDGAANFTLSAFTKMVEKMANLFERAQLFELVANALKLVLPLFERTHAHVKLIQAHAQIVSCLSRVDPPVLIDEWENGEMTVHGKGQRMATEGATTALTVPLAGMDKRCFGTYFRVRFYGVKFGELNGKEFVYKEPAITKLAEISARMEQFYGEKLGRETVETMKDSNEVDTAKLCPEKAYLQITFVEPHFERWEGRRRQTHLERSYGLSRFVYATPFTENGKAHGTVKEQWKRKTVLSLEKSFPYVKTRLLVVARHQFILCPIEVAIEDIQKRTRELRWAMLSEPRDLKMVQMQLQGCIGTTVNQGPIEIARVFLVDANLDADGMPRESLQRKLRLCFDKLTRACKEALEVNERLMEPGRDEYKRELRRNMCQFEDSLAMIFSNGAEVSSFPVSPPSDSVPSPAQLVHALAIAGKIGPVSSV